jgi:hypothetical protein
MRDSWTKPPTQLRTQRIYRQARRNCLLIGSPSDPRCVCTEILALIFSVCRISPLVRFCSEIPSGSVLNYHIAHAPVN